MRTLVRSGALVAQAHDDVEQTWLDLDPDGEDVLTQLQGASIRYRNTPAIPEFDPVVSKN